MTKSRDAREDFVGSLCPDERRRAFVRDVDVPDSEREVDRDGFQFI